MALVTLQRSPSPSNDPDEESGEGGEEAVDGRAAIHRKRSKSTLERLRKIFSTVRFISKLRPCLSESYFTVKGAALILPHNDLNRKTSRKNHGGEIQRHLQSMLYLLRPEDKIKVAIRLENQVDNEHRYLALVSTMGRQDTEECVILGLDCTTMSSSAAATPAVSPSSTASAGATAAVLFEGKGIALASIGLVIPVCVGIKVRLDGDGGFSISLDDRFYLFKPVSVQAMWSAIQSVDKALHQAEQMKYLPDGLNHTWVEYYRSKVDMSNKSRLTAWHMMEDVNVFAPTCLSFSNENESEKFKLTISAKLKEVMMSVDLDEVTCRFLRLEVEKALNVDLQEYRNYFDEELMRILGQMDAPSKILDHLYLGSEWNASNLEELQELGIKYILNITREIDNFFTGMFHYCNIRLFDVEESDLLKHWLKTYNFINKARKHGSKVLVHCKMGISRSASTVMAYLMKEKRLSLDEAYEFVKERRSCVQPNKGFMEQLLIYEGILNASYKREMFSKSEQDVTKAGEEGEDGEGNQQGTFLGDSLFRVMSGSEWPSHTLSPEEEALLREGGEHGFSGMEPDMETDSRSADSMEESLPDLPSPVTEQQPPSMPSQDLVSRSAEGEDRPNRLSQELAADVPGGPSKIKADSSWIKLEVTGESSTDPSPPEVMDVRETESQSAENEKGGGEQSLPEGVSAGLLCGMDSDAGGQPQVSDVGEQQQADTFDLGVHHYYSREQIPWNPGKVRNLREEFCPAGQVNPTAATSDAGSKCAETKDVSSTETLIETGKNISEEALSLVSQCESCLQLSPGDEGEEGGEGMDIDDQCRSVYEREDIQMTPGTVQRTRQKIEDQQKQQGEDTDHTIYGMKSIKRSSSVREERESSKNRNCERRKTCTPIVSPPPERQGEVEGVGPPMVEIGAAVLKLDFLAGESVTDDIEMEEDGEGKSGEQQDVTVYTFGEESVPVKAGIVRRQKQEIESKSREASGSQQGCLSFGSSESMSSGEDGEAAVQGSFLPLPTNHVCLSTGESGTVTDSVCGGQGGSQHIATAKQHSPQFSSLPAGTEVLGAKPSKPCTGSVSGAQAVFSSSIIRDRKVEDSDMPLQCLAAGSKGDKKAAGNMPHTLQDRQFSASEPSPLQDESIEKHGAHQEAFPFRPYAHSFPSTKRHVGKTHFDSETLAKIREIGSAFITSSPRKEEEEGSTPDKASLVKHLVKSIEKESQVPKQERKIVVIDSSGQPSKRQPRPQSASLFCPSPGFISSIERQLSQSSDQLTCPMDSKQSFQGLAGVPVCTVDPSGEALCGSLNLDSGVELGERGGGEQQPSVVKHLRGKFEGEHSSAAASDSVASGPQLPGGGCHLEDYSGDSFFVRDKDQFFGESSFNSGIFKSKSLEEQASGEFSESLSQAAPASASASSFLAQTGCPPPPQRPRSAEHIAHPYSLGLRHTAYNITRARTPWDRETDQDRKEFGGSEGAKVRRLHGKNHPLSRLQQQKQGDDCW